jgi:SAM-dependent methyltransferase
MTYNKIWKGNNGVEHFGKLCESLNEFDIIDCETCKFRHTVPIPTLEELVKIYNHEYYTKEKPLYIERYIEDQKWWDLVYSDRYDFLEENLAVNRRRILDIGSGPGLFLTHGKQRGWKTKGIEPSAKAAAYSRDILGLDIDELFLDETTAAKMDKFDAINLGEVLEHLPDPLDILGLIRSMLDDKGLICIIVPNDFNPFQLLLQKHIEYDPWWIAPPYHLNYFTPDSLNSLITKAGFDVIHMETTFPIEMFLLMGEKYIGNDGLGRKCHEMRKLFDENISKDKKLSKAFRKSMASMGIGREIVMYAIKA